MSTKHLIKVIDTCIGLMYLWHFLDQAGADVTTKGTHKFSPLIFAANEGLTDFYECLLEAGADPNVPDDVSFSFFQLCLLDNMITCRHMCMDLGPVLDSIKLALGLILSLSFFYLH